MLRTKGLEVKGSSEFLEQEFWASSVHFKLVVSAGDQVQGQGPDTMPKDLGSGCFIAAPTTPPPLLLLPGLPLPP